MSSWRLVPAVGVAGVAGVAGGLAAITSINDEWDADTTTAMPPSRERLVILGTGWFVYCTHSVLPRHAPTRQRTTSHHLASTQLASTQLNSTHSTPPPSSARPPVHRGALEVLRKANKANYDVTVVSPRPFFFYTPLLAGATVGTVHHGNIIEPIRNFVAPGGRGAGAAGERPD